MIPIFLTVSYSKSAFYFAGNHRHDVKGWIGGNRLKKKENFM